MGGSPKGLMTIHGRTFVEEIISKVRHITSSIYINANTGDFDFLDIPVFSDKITNKGPLGGIYSAMSLQLGQNYLFVPCDMPYIDEVILHKLVEWKDRAGAIVPSIFGKSNHMPLLMNNCCYPTVKHCIEEDKLRLGNLIDLLRTEMVRWEKAELFPIVSKNFNTPEDLKQLNASNHG